MQQEDAVGQTQSTTGRPKKRPRTASSEAPEIVLSLRRLDPILQFLTRATGKPNVPMCTLRAALPGTSSQRDDLLAHITELARRGILQLSRDSKNPSTPADALCWDDPILVGFPPPPSLHETDTHRNSAKHGALHGSTNVAAKRRLAALNRSLKSTPGFSEGTANTSTGNAVAMSEAEDTDVEPQKLWEDLSSTRSDADVIDDEHLHEPILEEERAARLSLSSMFRFQATPKTSQVPNESSRGVSCILKKQASYAGSNCGRESAYGKLSETALARIPPVLYNAFTLESPSGGSPSRTSSAARRKLYSHQADAINSAIDGTHTIVCTGTGSGKSMCFLIPVLTAAMGSTGTSGDAGSSGTSLLMFPTKALAQDQMTKLASLLTQYPDLQSRITPGIIDGDTPHAQRAEVAKECNIVMTNPDTLHAAILPGWKKVYRSMLERVRYIVIDEAHMYEGVFGAHVALVLSRLMRLCMVCSTTRNQDSEDCPNTTLPTFLACSATMTYPEHHFRLLCPIRKDAPVKVVANEDDGSPRSPKHFFVWNPPIMNIDGTSTGRVTISAGPRHQEELGDDTREGEKLQQNFIAGFGNDDDVDLPVRSVSDRSMTSVKQRRARSLNAVARTAGTKMYRRHAADETALLLARAVSNDIRCIVFAKTRSLCEWIFERTVSTLQSNSETSHLISRVESYRGGYTVEARRSIERRLFRNELLGVVGTSALELGVDIGGLDVSLHCGYPSSHNSLLQSAGRAGRGAACHGRSSLAIMISFNSPVEQHIWRYPKSLLSRGRSVPPSIPINPSILQGHLLCAADEFPLTGKYGACKLVQGHLMRGQDGDTLNDVDLLGSEVPYRESIATLSSNGSLIEETVVAPGTERGQVVVMKAHPFVTKPWGRTSIRSIEAVNYSIVDISHPLQGGKMDVVRDKAILDTIPYSRVFYHAFPGAIIMHRGKKYEVQCMTRPPAFIASRGACARNCSLAAFAKPTKARYSTRPLSSMIITIVKQMERVDIARETLLAVDSSEADGQKPPHLDSLAGNGIVTIKREVHGYKKLSPVTRVEISRSEISLPPMEFDTYAFWIDTEATLLSSQIPDYDAGVHALSHALLAVAPLFVPCSTSDIDCDHSFVECTRVMLFDVRAGGAGTCSQLWKFLFVPNGLLDAAIDLLTSCPSCDVDKRYSGGCPACLHCSQCLKFNQNLSRKAALQIARQMLKRLQRTEAYQRIGDISTVSVARHQPEDQMLASPRRRARAQALRNAKDLDAARERQFVVGRPSWPLDEEGSTASGQVHA